MIVLDTNQLHAIGVEQGTTLTLLRGVAQMTGHRLAIPVMVEQEYLATALSVTAASQLDTGSPGW